MFPALLKMVSFFYTQVYLQTNTIGWSMRVRCRQAYKCECMVQKKSYDQLHSLAPPSFWKPPLQTFQAKSSTEMCTHIPWKVLSGVHLGHVAMSMWLLSWCLDSHYTFPFKKELALCLVLSMDLHSMQCHTSKGTWLHGSMPFCFFVLYYMLTIVCIHIYQ